MRNTMDSSRVGLHREIRHAERLAHFSHIMSAHSIDPYTRQAAKQRRKSPFELRHRLLFLAQCAAFNR